MEGGNVEIRRHADNGRGASLIAKNRGAGLRNSIYRVQCKTLRGEIVLMRIDKISKRLLRKSKRQVAGTMPSAETEGPKS